MKKLPVDQYLHPLTSALHHDPYVRQVPWKFGINQKIQAKKLIASTGSFKNLTGSNSSGGTLTNSVINTALFQQGTVANSILSSSTISQPTEAGGTFTNPVINAGTLGTPAITGGSMNNGAFGTPLITGGTINSAVIGTPSIAGGTINPAVYQVAGSVGISTVVSYVKTVSPGTILGTLTFNSGILILSQ